jgi:hypothetical protein
MKTLILLLSVFVCTNSQAQNSPVSNEDFVNAVFKLVVTAAPGIIISSMMHMSALLKNTITMSGINMH